MSNVILLMVTLLAVGLIAIIWALKIYSVTRRYKVSTAPELKKDLPSVSVCIPARNEIHALAECLERVLASDYPKLEVIVLDDHSADDTSLIIRSFAHAGVRFIEGPSLPAGWIGKNFALETLVNEASGHYVCSIDVDTKLQPTSISRLVNTIVASKAAMISVVPDRYDSGHPAVYFGTLRYFWEILLSNRQAPPASSSVWMIERSLLIDELKGFSSLRTSVRPEVALASLVVAKNAGYQAAVHSSYLGIGYEKRWSSQIETSKRLLYQLFGGKAAMGIGAILWMILLNLPMIVVVHGMIFSWQMVHTVAAIVLGILIGLYGLYLSRSWRSKWWLGMLFWPYVILQELVLLVLSMIGYITNTITWKGRAVEKRSVDLSEDGITF